MALLTANGVDVLNGSKIDMPLVGVWVADIIIDQPDGSGFDAGTQVTISATDGVELTGTVCPDRTGAFLDAVHVRVLGGAGGTENDATARAYANPAAKVSDVLSGLMKDSGETLSETISDSVLSTNLNAWATVKVPVSHALVTLINFVAPGSNWRILPKGKLWIGAETWDVVTPEFTLIGNDPKEGTFDLGVDSPSILPGTSIDGIGKISKVQHLIESGKLRTRVWVEVQQEDRGVRAAIDEMVRQSINGIDYFTLYDAKLISQSSDLATVDVTPVDARLPGMQRVPLRHGLPGCKVQVSPGAFLRVGWDGGNPSKPYAAVWNGGESVQSIQLAGNTPVARKGDSINLGDCHVILSSGSVSQVWINGVQLPVGSDAPEPPDRGTISGGSDIVGCG